MWTEFKLFWLHSGYYSQSPAVCCVMQCIIIISDEEDQNLLFPGLTEPDRYPRNLRIVRIVARCDRTGQCSVGFDNLSSNRWPGGAVAGVRWWGWSGELLLPRQTGPDWSPNNHLTRRGRAAALIWSQITGDYDQLMSVAGSLVLIAISSYKTSD